MKIDNIIVNKKHPLPTDWISNITLVSAFNFDGSKALVEQKTYEQYLKLKQFLQEEYGIEIALYGGYRSIEEQKQIYREFVEQYGKEYADRYVAPPGMSEHHTGLAIDINVLLEGAWPTGNHEIEKQTTIFEKIHPYLSQFGFILRYPKGKEEITGYPYEPWHFRYVGEELAKKIEKTNQTLEEYKMNEEG